MKATRVIVMATLMVFAASVLAVRPADNLAGNVNISWNLSADVMPAPPYGLLDISKSDTASKLNVNQPNGNIEVVITGVMNGLNPNTTYTVLLSNGYVPYDTWDVTCITNIDIIHNGHHFIHSTNLVQDGTSITGGSLVYPGWPKDIDSGSVVGNAISIVSHYKYYPSAILTLDGTIAPDGSMSGIWLDTWSGLNRTGTWESTSDNAVRTGDVSWTGLFTSTVQPFTFTTDEFGAGSWHVNLQDADFPGPGTYELSVWINDGGTLLISDNFDVVVD